MLTVCLLYFTSGLWSKMRLKQRRRNDLFRPLFIVFNETIMFKLALTRELLQSYKKVAEKWIKGQGSRIRNDKSSFFFL